MIENASNNKSKVVKKNEESQLKLNVIQKKIVVEKKKKISKSQSDLLERLKDEIKSLTSKLEKKEDENQQLKRKEIENDKKFLRKQKKMQLEGKLKVKKIQKESFMKLKKLKKENKRLLKRLLKQTVVKIPFREIKYIGKEGEREILGRGGSGDVYKCKWESKVIALKEINLQFKHNEKVQNEIQKEIEVMKLVQHPLIVDVYGYTKIDDLKIGIALEFIDGNDLHKTIALAKRDGKKILNVEKWFIIKKMIESVNFLHLKGVRHRDIKPDNFLLSKDKKTIKLCDFGLAKMMESSSTKAVNKAPGTARFLAPEIMKTEKHSYSSDVFSLGLSIYEIVSEKRPFEKSRDDIAVLFKFRDGERPKFNKSVPKEFKVIYEMCISQDPNKRATANQLLGYINSKNIDFIQKYAVKESMTLLNLDYFFGKVAIEKKEKNECDNCFGEDKFCYKNPKCKHNLCGDCVLSRLSKLNNSIEDDTDIKIRCRNGCTHFLPFEWIAGIIMGAGISSDDEEDKTISSIFEMVKEIEKKIYFISCLYCNKFNDKRLIGKHDNYSNCVGCKASLCKLCSHKFIPKTNTCTYEGCDLSGSKWMILKTYENKLFPFHFNNRLPGEIPFCRMCPECGELNYRRNDPSGCKHCTSCNKCNGSFCFICLCVGKNPSNNDDGERVYQYTCGKDPWGFCELAPLQTRENQNGEEEEEEGEEDEDN